MGVVDVDFSYQRHVAQHVAAFVSCVRAAVDDGHGELIGVTERHRHRHGKQAVDLTGDGGEVGPRIFGSAQFDGEKEVGAHLARVDGRVLKQILMLAEFFVRELKEQVGLLPLRELGLVRVEGLARMRLNDCPKGLRVCAGYGLRPVAQISQRVQQCQVGGAKLPHVEIVESGLNGCGEGLSRHGRSAACSIVCQSSRVSQAAQAIA